MAKNVYRFRKVEKVWHSATLEGLGELLIDDCPLMIGREAGVRWWCHLGKNGIHRLRRFRRLGWRRCPLGEE